MQFGGDQNGKERGTKDEMTGAKDGDRPLSSDDRVHVRIKRFSQKEAGREGAGGQAGYLKTARRGPHLIR